MQLISSNNNIGSRKQDTQRSYGWRGGKLRVYFCLVSVSDEKVVPIAVHCDCYASQSLPCQWWNRILAHTFVKDRQQLVASIACGWWFSNSGSERMNDGEPGSSCGHTLAALASIVQEAARLRLSKACSALELSGFDLNDAEEVHAKAG